MVQARHLGVYGLVVEDDKVLLVKKARGAYTGKYDLPGGSIEHGERPIETLKREFMEETGVEIKDANLLLADSVIVEWLHHDEEESMHHIGIIYEVSLENGIVKEDADGLDSLGALWYPLKDLTVDNLSPLAYIALKEKGKI